VTALVVGLGTAHGDDAVGIQVARRIAATGSGIDVVESDDPAGLIDLWAGRGLVVVVDAVVSGAAPGSLAVLDATAAPLPGARWAGGGTHALGLTGAVELARTLGRLPERLVVVGVEAGLLQPGAAVSDAVEAAVGAAVEAVLGLVAVRPVITSPYSG
jgi:hydrogenase maturation protease